MHQHLLWWRFFPKKELTHVYLAVALRSFALSLLGVFIPIYLVQERGLSVVQVLLFFMFYSVMVAVSAPLAAKFSARYGVKWPILLSVPCYLIYLGILFWWQDSTSMILLGGITSGLSIALYWMGMHLAFYHASHAHHRGEELGIRSAVSIIAALLSPLAGGIIIRYLGFGPLFGVASLVLLIAAGILMHHKEDHQPYHFHLRTVFNTHHWRDALFFISRGSDIIAAGVLWPLFIFGILGSYISLGVAGTLVSAATVLLFWAVGKYSDHHGKRKIVNWSTWAYSLVWIARAFVSTVPQVFGITFITGLVEGIRESPLAALEYNKARGEVAAYFVNREVFVSIGRVLLLVLVLIINSISGGFIAQAIINLAALLF